MLIIKINKQSKIHEKQSDQIQTVVIQGGWVDDLRVL